jgi:nicotinate-nucleotide pyrophosphorylase (carboxylating)
MDFQTPEILKIIDLCLAEDVGDGDHSSLGAISHAALGISNIYFKANGLLAGLDLAEVICQRIDSTIDFKKNASDGDFIKSGAIIATVKGRAQSLLKAERLLLNFMQRMSGIATTTFYAVQEVKDTKVKLLDTRKTTPGLRVLEKYAVKVGGGYNHRFGLFDMVMLKDNHNDSAGSITQAVGNTVKYLKEKGLNLKIEVETRNLKEINEALATGKVDRIMLDNFSPQDCKEAIITIDKQCETEASGGINMVNLKEYALTGVDYISLGFLTHSFSSIDISMKTKVLK